MADVSVTFGATDEGLEKTLKAVQGELNSLKDKVKAGGMSMTELEGTMKRIGQVTSMEKNIKAIGDQSQGTTTQVKALGTAAQDTGKKGEIGFGKIAVGATLAGAAAKIGSMAIEAAFSVAQKTVQSFGDALNMGGRLNDLADRTGIAVDKVLLLERAFQNAGVGADSLGPIINKMQKALVDAEDGTSKAAYAFADLGLSLSKLQSMSPEEQLRTIGKAIAGIPDPAQRAATAMEIFGKSGGALNQVFANFDDEIQTAKLQLGSLPEVMKAGSSQFDRISDNLVVVGGKFIEFAAGLIDKVKPALDAVTTALSMIDAAGIGQEIGEFFVGAGEGMKMFQKSVDEFKVGNFSEGFKAAFEAIKMQAMETANSVYTKLSAAFKTAGDFISSQFSLSGPLVALFQDFATLISGYISEKLYLVMADFMDAIGKSGMAETFRYQAETSAREVQAALDVIPIHAELTAEKASESMGDIPANFKKNMADVPPLFDKVTKKQDDVVKKTQEIIDADKEWEAQAMARINKDVDASQRAIKEKKAGQKELADGQSAEDERAANARKKYEEDHKKQAQLKRDQIADEIKINNAIANGNTKLADALKNSQSLNKTIKDLADAGLNEATKEAEKLADELARSAREADRVKNSLATKIGSQVEEKQKSQAIDPGGKLQKKAQEQIAAGQYKAAEATGQQLAMRELGAEVRGFGPSADRRSEADIVKDYYGSAAPSDLTKKEQLDLTRQAREEGVYKDFSKMTDTSKKGLDRFANLAPDEKKQEALDKAKKGMEKGVPETQKDMTSKTGAEEGGAKGEGGKGSNSVMESIKTAVEAIKTAIEKIEPKLPTAALST